MKKAVICVCLFTFTVCLFYEAYCAIPSDVLRNISKVNSQGPYLGIIVPNKFEMDPLLQSPSFIPDKNLPYIDFAGRRFRIGTLESQRIILVMTGLSMVNAGVTTQLTLNLFNIKGVVHFGVAGNLNPDLQIGDVTIPKYWAHTGLWNWQVERFAVMLVHGFGLSSCDVLRCSLLFYLYGDGPNDTLALEVNGDYTRDIGFLEFDDYTYGDIRKIRSYNLLNRVWFQPEEVFPVDGEPELRQHAFWIPVDQNYLAIADKLKDVSLESCVDSNCLPRQPIVVQVERGISAAVFVDNQAYREFLYTKFNATLVDMETAAVALICLQQKTPFIAIRALSDLAGGGGEISNEADIFAPLASVNAVNVFLKFVSLLKETQNVASI